MTNQSGNGAPIPMRLTCPSCGELHVDRGEFATKPHHTHACQTCGMVWRPAVQATVGVQFLPGFQGDRTRAEAESYRRMYGTLPTGWTEQDGIDEERRRKVAAWGARHAMCFGGCRHEADRCDGGTQRPTDSGRSTACAICGAPEGGAHDGTAHLGRSGEGPKQ